ncbi:MAG: glycoside hydrolase family 113 [Planctomycetota bacterium]
MHSPATSLRPPPLLAIRVAVVVLLLAPMSLVLLGRGAPLPVGGITVPRPAAPGSAGEPVEPPAVLLRGPDAVPPPEAPGQPVLGVAMVVHHVGDMALYRRSIDRIAALGANAVNVVTPMFQRYVHSSSIEMLPERCPTDRQLVELLSHARSRGLQTTLQPIVLIDRPGEKDWRGLIRPDSWDQWWASYEQFIDRYLRIAAAAQVDVLTIGSELNSTESQVDRWRGIAARVRAAFDGPITYSANWDRYDKIVLWELVDFMSVSSYFELVRDDQDAPEAALVADWARHRDRLITLATDWQRPLMLGEVGYPSLPWASAHPWNYVAPKGTAADHAAQARCYRAFFAAWREAVVDRNTPVRGFFCYHWDPYHHGQGDDTGYGFDGKPAYGIIRQALADLAREATARRMAAEDR